MILCAAVRCRMLSRHVQDCDTECRGCLPRPAADGRNLCEVCTRRLGEDAVQAAELYVELEYMLARPQGFGEKTSGSKSHGLEMNGRAMEARRLIRHTLSSWCALVAEERGITTPKDLVAAMGDYVRSHQEWLSAHGAAGDCSSELGELAHGSPRRAAYPNPVSVVELGPCPMPECEGKITAVVRKGDALLPSAVECNQPPEDGVLEPHIWPWGSDEWRVLKRDLIMAMERYPAMLGLSAA